MPSYLVTGASRGIGFEFLRQISADPAAVVIGLVRDKAGAEKKVAAEIGRTNIHLLQGDVTDYESLKKAAGDTAKITGGGLDYLIANAAIASPSSGYKTFSDMSEDPKALEDDILNCYKTNVVGNIHLFNLFLPLIQRGEVKKVIAISSGMGDLDLVINQELDMAGPYSISKAALNLAVAKFSAEFKSEGILFMSVSPGVVETSGSNNLNELARLSEKELKMRDKMGRKFAEVAPHFKGPIMPEESVRLVMDVIKNASVEHGDGGSFVSHHGNKQWL